MHFSLYEFHYIFIFFVLLSPLSCPVVNPWQVSLAQLGYVDFGVDEGWELCNKTSSVPGGLQHDASGQLGCWFP